ncbi:YjgB family protein [Paenibacillus sp. HB172176]|uniref:YjgB family protein n=1 Tax=Paenibacillus sp. HB172176 TaxID=2493690 RepID=UPI00143ADF9D|nr:YjgB family protein [Paenibacillus sp. HB172176]
MKKKWILMSGAIAAALLLNACSSNNNNVEPTVSPTEETTPEATATPDPSPSASPPATATDKPATDAPTTDAPASNHSDNADEDTDAMIKDMLKLAKEGKISGIPFAAHTGLIDDVEKSWGEPDQRDSADYGYYVTYEKKNAAFGINKGDQIYDVRSFDPKLNSITLKQIEAALGKPDKTTENGDDKIYTYDANDDFQLKFVIPGKTGTVDHINVYNPKDGFNNMAG